MKKVLILINNSDLPVHALNFALRLTQKTQAKLNGLFLNTEEDRTRLSSEPLDTSASTIFAEYCSKASIKFNIQHVPRNSTDEIIDETAFADLVVCNDDTSTIAYSVQSLISSSHCPILLVQANDIDFNEVLLCYDGNISSINAIKQFTYLFSWMTDQKVYLVSVLPVNIKQMEYDSLVREWVTLHYPLAEVVVLRGDLKSELSHFVQSKPHSLVVMGAFGRSALSRFFKESLATTVLDKTQASLFISHS